MRLLIVLSVRRLLGEDNMKPLIGIISNRVENADNPFETKTSFNETYPKRIIESGGIPIGVIFPNDEFQKDVLDMCDGFVLQGGFNIYSSNINAVHYACLTRKPILGICMGFQTMLGYEWIRKEFGGVMPSYREISDFFKPEDEVNFIEKKSGHDELDPFYLSMIDKSKHGVLLSKNSKLAHIFGENYLDMPSVHAWSGINKVLMRDGAIFKVVGRSNDGNMEAIESNNSDWWAIGVQFHPELEEKNLPLFESLVYEAKVKKLRK